MIILSYLYLSLVQVRLLQTIKTENQLLLAFQLIGPFLQRIQTESTKLLLEVNKRLAKEIPRVIKSF
jgi:hypothetical protein